MMGISQALVCGEAQVSLNKPFTYEPHFENVFFVVFFQTAGLTERIKANEMYNGFNQRLINLLKKTTGCSLFLLARE